MLFKLINTDSSLLATGLNTSTKASVMLVIEDLAILFVSSPFI